MPFEDDYKVLKRLAVMLIRKNELPIEPDDLINNAYLQLADQEKEYSFLAIKSLMFEDIYKEVERIRANWKLTKKTNRHCGVCKENKPNNAFHFRNKEKAILEDICKECKAERDKINRAKRAKELKILEKYRYVKYTEEQLEKRRQSELKRYRKSRAELTDAYIKGYLRSKYKLTTEQIEADPELIVRARKHLEDKRKKLWYKKIAEHRQKGRPKIQTKRGRKPVAVKKKRVYKSTKKDYSHLFVEEIKRAEEIKARML